MSVSGVGAGVGGAGGEIGGLQGVDGPQQADAPETAGPETAAEPPADAPAPGGDEQDMLGAIAAAAGSIVDRFSELGKENPTAPAQAKGDVETKYEGPPIPKGQWQKPMPDTKPAKPTIDTVKKANEILKRKDLPIGSTVEFESNGKKYVARAEWHKHPPTDNVAPGLKEWHRGITVYEKK